MFIEIVKGYCPGSSESQSRDIFGHNCSDDSVVVSSHCSLLKYRNQTTTPRHWCKMSKESIPLTPVNYIHKQPAINTNITTFLSTLLLGITHEGNDMHTTRYVIITCSVAILYNSADTLSSAGWLLLQEAWKVFIKPNNATIWD